LAVLAGVLPVEVVPVEAGNLVKPGITWRKKMYKYIENLLYCVILGGIDPDENCNIR
jgi:hypothetical protein